MGKYRVPSLRNLAFTAPYFHDGSCSHLLTEVIDAYANGGRQIEEGIYKGDGAKNPFKHHVDRRVSRFLKQRKSISSVFFKACLIPVLSVTLTTKILLAATKQKRNSILRTAK